MRLWPLLFALLLLALLAPCGSEGPSLAAICGKSFATGSGSLATDTISFESDGAIPGISEVYLVKADASLARQAGLVRLTNGGAEAHTWSPDGTRIAFHRDSFYRQFEDLINLDIFAIKADQTGLARLTTDLGQDFLPKWSPNGQCVLFISDREGNPELYLMKADGSHQMNLTKNAADDTYGVLDVSLFPNVHPWSPDGLRIAFQRGTTRRSEEGNLIGDLDIYLIGVDGNGLTQITNGPAIDYFVTWFPDGDRILFSSDREGNAEIYVIKSDGSSLVNLTHNLGEDFFGAWSPDGQRLAFISDRDGNFEIYVMKVDGSEVTRLTDNPQSDGRFGLTWSPDGARIAFTKGESFGAVEVWLMNADGSGQARLAGRISADQVNSADNPAFFPTWVPAAR